LSCASDLSAVPNQQPPELTQVWHSYLRVKLDDLCTARKIRLTGSQDEIPGELWVLLLGGGVLMLVFTYMFGTSDVVIHATLIGLAAALMAVVLYLIFALAHSFVGSLIVPVYPYLRVLQMSMNPATPTHLEQGRGHVCPFDP
jgi:hypothetical protein